MATTKTNRKHKCQKSITLTSTPTKNEQVIKYQKFDNKNKILVQDKLKKMEKERVSGKENMSILGKALERGKH